MGTYKYWTEAEITQLKRLVGEDKTANEIATALGRNKNSIDNQKRKLGLRKMVSYQIWTDTETACLTELLRQGKTGYEIAEALGRTYKSTETKKKRLGITKPTPSYAYWSEWEMLKLRRYCKRGYPLDRICTYFPNRSRKMVSHKVKQMTRYWFTPAQKEARRLAKEKEWEWRVW